MAITLTMENFSYAEPMKKNRFLVQFQQITGITDISEGLTLACHACGTPKLTISQQELHRFNDRVYVPGKGEFNEIDFEFYEYISTPKGSNSKASAGNLLWDWQKKVYDPATGISGYKQDITTGVLIVQFDGEGNVVRTWNLYHAWPTGVEFDGLDSKSDDIQNVKVTLRYDWASQTNSATKSE